MSLRGTFRTIWLGLGLMLAPSVGTPAERTASGGVLVFWGNTLQPPYRLSLTRTRFMVNARSVELPRGTPAPASQSVYPFDLTARFTLFQTVFSTANKDRQSGAGSVVICNNALSLLRASPLVEKAEISGPLTITVLWATDHTTEYVELKAAGTPPSVEETASRYLEGLAATLQAGGMVLIGGGYDVHIPSARVEETKRHLAALRRGDRTPLDQLPEPLLASLRHPSRLHTVSR